MKREWHRIDTWLAQNAPHIRTSLNDGATYKDLNATEDALNVALPNNVRESYLIHDGQGGDLPALFDGMFYLLTLEGMVEEWRVMQEVMRTSDVPNESQEDSPEVRSYWWHDKWIPIFSNGAGDLWCVDLDPSAYGTRGQIIEFWHDDVGRTLIARDLRTLLRQFANDLENDHYEIDATGLYPPEDDDVDDDLDALDLDL